MQRRPTAVADVEPPRLELDVDLRLDGIDDEPQRSGNRPAPEPEVQRWPGESDLEQLADDPAGADEAGTEPPQAPGGDVPVSEQVDVDSAVSDKNVGLDRKLRDLGWEKYGEKLRSRGHPRPPARDKKDKEEDKD